LVVVAEKELDGVTIAEGETLFGVVTTFVAVVRVIIVVGVFGVIIVVGPFGVFGVSGVEVVDCTAVGWGEGTTATALAVVTDDTTTTVLAGPTIAAVVGVDEGGTGTVIAADWAKGSAQQYEEAGRRGYGQCADRGQKKD